MKHHRILSLANSQKQNRKQNRAVVNAAVFGWNWNLDLKLRPILTMRLKLRLSLKVGACARKRDTNKQHYLSSHRYLHILLIPLLSIWERDCGGRKGSTR